jgi:hypothetical protein
MTVDRAELKRLLELDNMSLHQIGQAFGVSRQRIKQLADYLGYLRTDQRVRPDKPEFEPVVYPWSEHPQGMLQWKKDNAICQHSGCLVSISTKTLCRGHADAMAARARDITIERRKNNKPL